MLHVGSLSANADNVCDTKPLLKLRQIECDTYWFTVKILTWTIWILNGSLSPFRGTLQHPYLVGRGAPHLKYQTVTLPYLCTKDATRMKPALLKSYSHFRGNTLVVVKMGLRCALLAVASLDNKEETRKCSTVGTCRNTTTRCPRCRICQSVPCSRATCLPLNFSIKKTLKWRYK
jgi:hypothetical protein